MKEKQARPQTKIPLILSVLKKRGKVKEIPPPKTKRRELRKKPRLSEH